MHRILKNQRGFTLIELVIIIILIGLLAGVAIPRFVNLRQKAAIASLKANADAMRGALTLDFANRTLNQGSYTSPVDCPTPNCEVTGAPNLTALHNLLEAVPNYPTSGKYNTPAGAGFRWYITNVVATTGSTPPQIKAGINSGEIGLASCTVITGFAACDVDAL